MKWATHKYKCNVSIHRSAAVLRNISRLRKKYRNIKGDIKVSLKRIRENYREAASAKQSWLFEQAAEVSL